MVLGSLVFILYLYFFVGPQDIIQVVQRIDAFDYAIYYSLALGAMSLVLLFWAASWHLLLFDLDVKTRFKSTFMYYAVGYFVDLVTPIQSVGGEVTRLYLVHRDTKQSYGAIAASTIINRTIAYIVLTVGISAASIYLLVRSSVPDFALGLLVLTWLGALISLGVLLYLGFVDKAAQKLTSVALKVMQAVHLKKSSEGFSPKTMEALMLFEEGFKFFRSHPRRVMAPILFQVLAFLSNLSVYFFVFLALGFNNLSFDFFLVIFFLASAIQEAAGVFSVGALDIFLTSVFIFFSIPEGASGVAAALLRIVIFWFPLLLGYGAAQAIGMRDLLNNHKQEAVKEQQPINLNGA
jgi:uncharacterized protein (TIRG00374 family)